MPALIAAFLVELVEFAGTLAGQVLLSLGFSILTYTGMSITLSWAQSQVTSQFAGLPADVANVLSTLGLGVDIAILGSALATRLALDGLSAGGTISKLVKTA